MNRFKSGLIKIISSGILLSSPLTLAEPNTNAVTYSKQQDLIYLLALATENKNSEQDKILNDYKKYFQSNGIKWDSKNKVWLIPSNLDKKKFMKKEYKEKRAALSKVLNKTKY